ERGERAQGWRVSRARGGSGESASRARRVRAAGRTALPRDAEFGDRSASEARPGAPHVPRPGGADSGREPERPSQPGRRDGALASSRRLNPPVSRETLDWFHVKPALYPSWRATYI